MRTFLATKHDKPWVITFNFNGTGTLIRIELPAEFEREQVEWIVNRLPLSTEEIERFARQSQLRVEEQITQVTFDEFYRQYAVKEGRKKAETAWAKLSTAEQIKAHKYVPVLRSKKHLTGENLPYPATYLNQQRWND
jgi:hypothetical protein